MEALAYYDGKIGTPEELTVPFNDRVHFFGDGVYDATVGANGKVYLLQDHLDRFYTSARALDIHIPMPKDELGRLLTDLLAKVDGTTHFVYWQVTRGVETRNHVYAEDLPGKLWVSIRQNHLNDPDVPIKLNTEEDTRFYHCNIKTLNLLPSVVAAQHAKRIGVLETVFHRGDIVTECAHSNVSILKDGVFYSHPNDEFILRGIAKTHMIQACYRLGITVMEKCFTLDDLRSCELVPFAQNVNNAPLIMAAHITVPQVTGDDIPASLSSVMLTDLLRGELGYQGLIVTDSLAMQAITDVYTPGQAAVKALQAGADLLLMPNGLADAYTAVLEAVQDGTIPQQRLDESVQRILQCKYQYGILTQ